MLCLRLLHALRCAVLACALGVLGSCTPPPCGGAGQACCTMGASCGPGLACGGGCQTSCAACGASGQACCTSGASCSAGLVCTGPAFGSTFCTPCGAPGLPCCTGASCTGAGVTCQGTTLGGAGTCVACGGSNQPCCAGGTCGAPYQCSVNRSCGLCGGSGEACCPGAICHGSLVCSSGSTCESCGALREPCCGGESCPVSGTCSFGICSSMMSDAAVTPTSCTPDTCAGPTARCISFPLSFCSHACNSDTECGLNGACSHGACVPSCTPGGLQCAPYGGACSVGFVAYTSIDAPSSATAPQCLPSCFSASASAPHGYPSCPAGTACDAVTGECTARSTSVTLGAPCTGAADCAGTCIAPTDPGGSPTGFVGGYCVTFALNPPASAFAPGAPLPSSNCASGGVAIPYPSSRPGDAVPCYAGCHSDCDCREGYHCDHDPLQFGGTPSPNGACLPIDCSAPGSACPAQDVCFHGGRFAHLLHSVCGVASTGDAGIDGGYDPTRFNAGCAAGDASVTETGADAGMDASGDAGIDAAMMQ